MNNTEYTYSVIRYRHDPSAGEMLNIGVLAYSADTGQVGLRFDPRYARLSEAFVGFDGDHYRRVMERFQYGVESLGNRLAGNLFELDERRRFSDAASIARSVWPDQGLSYQVGVSMAGITYDLAVEVDDLFRRFVLSQYEREERRQRRDDNAVWEEFKKAMAPRGIMPLIKPVTLGANGVEFRFAFKNEKWHVMEPISLDYVDPADISRRAYRTLGEAFALRREEDLGTYYVLLGQPRDESDMQRYQQVYSMISEMPVNHRIVETGDAEQFAADLACELRAHGILTAENEAA